MSIQRMKDWLFTPELDVGSSLFVGAAEMSTYTAELTNLWQAAARDEAIEKLGWVDGTTGEFDDVPAERLYAIARKHEPETIVETGVCNGYSTLHLLLALQQNDAGQLISIDYPFRADRDLEEFRADTYNAFGGAQIPADKDPGWIIPDELLSRWTLHEGKSQVELPKVLADHGEIDMFIHDSEHSSLCMAMEMDLAWHYLRPGGVLIVDDVSWSDAWDEFLAEREPAKSGLVTQDVAYALKGESE